MPIFSLQPEWTLGQNTPLVKNFVVADGKQGNLETVEIMRRVARQRASHPLVRELALKILLVAGVPSQYYKNEALAIGRYVKEKVRYVRDIHSVETLTDPVTLIDMLMRGEAQGDCDDISLLIATLLLSIGHQPYFRVVRLLMITTRPFSIFM
jgi:transglutaminase-like putative cysteine protease